MTTQSAIGGAAGEMGLVGVEATNEDLIVVTGVVGATDAVGGYFTTQVFGVDPWNGVTSDLITSDTKQSGDILIEPQVLSYEDLGLTKDEWQEEVFLISIMEFDTSDVEQGAWNMLIRTDNPLEEPIQSSAFEETIRRVRDKYADKLANTR